jgi:hypothetical protein
MRRKLKRLRLRLLRFLALIGEYEASKPANSIE